MSRKTLSNSRAMRAAVVRAICVIAIAALAFGGVSVRCWQPMSAFAEGDATNTSAASDEDTTLKITEQPATAYVHVGNTATFAVETNDEKATYQWQQCVPSEDAPAAGEETGLDGEESGDSSEEEATWENVSSGGTDNELSLTVSEDNKDYQYRCVVTFSDGTEETSDAVGVTLPVITKQPTRITIQTIGAKGTLTIASNDPGATYQWQRSMDGGLTWENTIAEGSSQTSCPVTLSKENAEWTYRCIVRYSDKVTEESDVVGINAISKQPQGVYAEVGGDASFSVGVTAGSEVKGFQWKWAASPTSKATSISGATSTTLSFSDLSTTDMKRYYACTVTFSDDKTATSSWAYIDSIIMQPQNVDASDFPDVVFDIEANDEDASYHWQYSENAGATWLEFDEDVDADSSELAPITDESQISRTYRCVVTFSDGVVAYSDTVGVSGAFTLQPSNQRAAVGEVITFEAATLDSRATYAWEYSDDGETWLPAEGESAATNTLTVTVTEENFNRLYRCVATFSDGTIVTSDSAHAIPRITEQPANVMGVVGGSVDFSVATNGGDGTTYAWMWSSDGKSGWTNEGLSGADGQTLSVDVTDEVLGRWYRCTVTFPDGTSEVSQSAQIQKAVCAIGNVPYASLVQAREAASAGDTIALVSDAECDTFTNGSKDLTLDLNGHILIGSVTAGDASLTVVDSVGSDGTYPTVTGLVSGNNLIIKGGVYNRTLSDPSGMSSLIINDVKAHIAVDKCLVSSDISLGNSKDSDAKSAYENKYKQLGALVTGTGAVEGVSVSYYGFHLYVIDSHELVAATTECGDVAYYVCTRCGKGFTDESAQTIFDATQYRHKLVLVPEVAATCTTTGHRAYYECSVCGELFKDSAATQPTTIEEVTTATSHAKQLVTVKEPTCTEVGVTQQYWRCYLCGMACWDEEFTQVMDPATVTVPALGHNWGEWEIVIPATCKEHGEGLKEHTCTQCGITEQETIPIAAHTPEKVEAVAATCTAGGTEAYYKCTVCDLCFEDEECTVQTSAVEKKVAPLGHLYLLVQAHDATCTEDGCIEHYECKRCGKYFIKYADGTYSETTQSAVMTELALGHDVQYCAAVEPTCTAYGNYEYYKCTRCGALFSDAAATTPMEAAAINRDPLGHSLEYVAYVAPTETTEGCDAHWICTRCGVALTEDQSMEGTIDNFVIPALGVSESDDSGTTYYSSSTSTGTTSSSTSGSSTSAASALASTLGSDSTNAALDDSEDNQAESDDEAQAESAEPSLLDTIYESLFDATGAPRVELIASGIGYAVLIALCIALALLVRSGKSISPRKTGRYAASASARLAAKMREDADKKEKKEKMEFSYTEAAKPQQATTV